ncbi:unnamed protein product [Symbiodinium natans]|uniref:Uncharacterized protein n=1 Tax=Symbiodinium natans TaxID=878477 RepID=A0A812UWN3_9DINO|nr:unnamed protein product [Symbiodinium natans]
MASSRIGAGDYVPSCSTHYPPLQFGGGPDDADIFGEGGESESPNQRRFLDLDSTGLPVAWASPPALPVPPRQQPRRRRRGLRSAVVGIRRCHPAGPIGLPWTPAGPPPPTPIPSVAPPAPALPSGALLHLGYGEAVRQGGAVPARARRWCQLRGSTHTRRRRRRCLRRGCRGGRVGGRSTSSQRLRRCLIRGRRWFSCASPGSRQGPLPPTWNAVAAMWPPASRHWIGVAVIERTPGSSVVGIHKSSPSFVHDRRRLACGRAASSHAVRGQLTFVPAHELLCRVCFP